VWTHINACLAINGICDGSLCWVGLKHGQLLLQLQLHCFLLKERSAASSWDMSLDASVGWGICFHADRPALPIFCKRNDARLLEASFI